ncbi:MAG TPA: aminodeoxychorismate synthase component I [Vicinamibacterales bacterium]|nr:aminodeoxychorismate synthase component I [Vicinamibacterales bacterium]
MKTVVRDAGSGKWRLFERPTDIIVAKTVHDVLPALASVEEACARQQRYAAGFLSYEAAPAFDPALQTQAVDDFPLLWFGIYDGVEELALDELGPGASGAFDEQWDTTVSKDQYAEVFAQLQELIRSGDTYQVNYTYRLRTRLTSDPFALFLRMANAQSPPFGAFVDTGEWAICSASPELFFHRSGERVESRPMKGTAARGLWFEHDLEHARRLRESEKERAENVMIVDMVRNDLGRVARPGTVRVTNLFDVERYPTVLQLTSTVTAETDASLVDVMKALFPAASITGAPKARTMEIIAAVERSPRRIYTGTVGFVEPGGRAQFNVAIRTVLLNLATREAEYGIGGGIVADSIADDEWHESQIKARALAAMPPAFELLETMLWMPDAGYLLLGRHLKRLLQSADYFGFHIDIADVREQLERYAAELPPLPQRVRLVVSRRGSVEMTSKAHDVEMGFPEIALAVEPIDPANPFLYHKTTNREVYEHAIASRPGFADVLLYNNRGEITESTIANLVVDIGGELITPPVACGLLPGTLRAHLLDEKKIREGVITVQRLSDASRCYLVNSVRGFHPVSVAYRSVIRCPSL